MTLLQHKVTTKTFSEIIINSTLKLKPSKLKDKKRNNKLINSYSSSNFRKSLLMKKEST